MADVSVHASYVVDQEARAKGHFRPCRTAGAYGVAVSNTYNSHNSTSGSRVGIEALITAGRVPDRFPDGVYA